MHTPGPWYVGAMTDQLYIINEPPRPAPKDYENTSLKTLAIAKTFEAPNGFTEEEANARLIASAPELLAALEGSWQYLVAWRFEYRDKPNDEHNNAQRDRIDAQIREVEAAIAKAKP